MSEGGAIPERAEDEELEQLLIEKAPRPKLPIVTTALVGLLVLGLGFVGGVWIEKNHGSSNSGRSAAAAFGAARAARTGAAGATAGGTGATTRGGTGAGATGTSGVTAGTVTLIDGDNMYVTTTSGSVVKVKTTTATKVTANESVPLSKVAPGSTVVVQGTTNSDGTVSATSVSQGGTTGGFGGFGGGNG